MSSKGLVFFAVSAALCFCASCVERKVTIITDPPGALVALNDEEIGTSPVTVGFEWYGDFAVRISKPGYKTLNTHQNLKRPMKDVFPLDLMADAATTKVDSYTWNFKLEPDVPVQKDELIKSAVVLQKEAIEPNDIGKKPKVKKVKPAAENTKTK